MKSCYLKIVSICLLIVGILNLLAMGVSLWAGEVYIDKFGIQSFMSEVGIKMSMTVAIFVIVIIVLGSVSKILAAIIGIKCCKNKKYNSCRVISWIVLILSICPTAITAIQGDLYSINIKQEIMGEIMPILYFVFARFSE